MCGPDGLGGEAVSAAFGQDKAADVLRPGPVLAALTAQAVAEPASLTDDELVGALQAARRLANHAAYQQTVVIAEFARRRQAQFEAAKARGSRSAAGTGSSPARSSPWNWSTTRGLHRRPDRHGRRADHPAAAHPGRDGGRQRSTWPGPARSRPAPAAMTDADAAYADEVLAAAAPGHAPGPAGQQGRQRWK